MAQDYHYMGTKSSGVTFYAANAQKLPLADNSFAKPFYQWHKRKDGQYVMVRPFTNPYIEWAVQFQIELWFAAYTKHFPKQN
jgi:hypothetical protein